MNLSARPLDPLRSAALTLHGLASEDRDWLLGRLSETHRALLLPLLEELRSLGIPGDPQLVQDLGSRPEPAPAVPAWPQQLSGAEVATLARVLAGEPVALTRFLLAMQPWPWTAQFLEHLGEARRHTLEAAPAPIIPAPLLQAAILEALHARCACEPPEPRPGSWRRARARLARWRARA